MPFNLERETDRFTSRIVRGIRSPSRRAEVKREYTEHIEDAVYHYMIEGNTDKEAFRIVCDKLGDTSKIQELLSVVHNRDSFPKTVGILLCMLAAGIFTTVYFLIKNDTFIAWITVILQIFSIIVICIALYFVWRFITCLRIRRKSYQKIKKYAQKEGIVFRVNSNSYLSLIKKTVRPEWVLETDKKRYIISLWATVRKNKTLKLIDNLLYTYMDNVGYLYIYTRNRYTHAQAGWSPFTPKDMEGIPLYASDMVQLPRELHLMPQIEWESLEKNDKENVRVLLLNPIPRDIVGIERGIFRNLGDDSLFCGIRIWSASGFISFLEGLRISEKEL